MNTYDLLPGDRLLTKKGIVTHSGTYMGNGMVAHISAQKNMIIEPVSKFSSEQEPKVIRNGGIEEHKLWHRLEMCKKHPHYSALSNNCEDISNFLETGIKRSPQRAGAIWGCLGGYTAAKAMDVKDPLATCLFVTGGALVGMIANRPKAKKSNTKLF